MPDVLSIEIANALLLLGYSFLFAGARAFAGRDTPVTVFLVAPLIWLTAMKVPAIAHDINLRVIIVSGLQCSLVALTAYELWRERAEPLLSRWPAIILLVTHVVMLNARMVTVMMTPVVSHTTSSAAPMFALMAFGTVLYTIALRVPAAVDDQGAQRAAPQDRGADRSAHRARQPARLHERRRAAIARPRVAQRAARGAARRSRPLQEDQRRLRPRDRRSGAEDLRRDAEPLRRHERPRRPARRRGVRDPAARQRRGRPRSRSPSAFARVRARSRRGRRPRGRRDGQHRRRGLAHRRPDRPARPRRRRALSGEENPAATALRVRADRARGAARSRAAPIPAPSQAMRAASGA